MKSEDESSNVDIVINLLESLCAESNRFHSASHLRSCLPQGHGLTRNGFRGALTEAVKSFRIESFQLSDGRRVYRGMAPMEDESLLEGKYEVEFASNMVGAAHFRPKVYRLDRSSIGLKREATVVRYENIHPIGAPTTFMHDPQTPLPKAYLARMPVNINGILRLGPRFERWEPYDQLIAVQLYQIKK